MWHYCPQGHSHSVRNTGEEPLVIRAVLPKTADNGDLDEIRRKYFGNFGTIGEIPKRLDKRGWEGYNATIPRMLEERTDGTMKKLRTNMMMLGMCMGSMCMRRCANSVVCFPASVL